MKKLVALLMALVLALSCTAAFAEEAAAATGTMTGLSIALDETYVKAIAGAMDPDGSLGYAQAADAILQVLDNLGIYVVEEGNIIQMTMELGDSETVVADLTAAADENGISVVSSLFPHYVLRADGASLADLTKVNYTLNGQSMSEEEMNALAQQFVNGLTPYIQDMQTVAAQMTSVVNEDGSQTVVMTTSNLYQVLSAWMTRLSTDTAMQSILQMGLDAFNEGQPVEEQMTLAALMQDLQNGVESLNNVEETEVADMTVYADETTGEQQIIFTLMDNVYVQLVTYVNENNHQCIDIMCMSDSTGADSWETVYNAISSGENTDDLLVGLTLELTDSETVDALLYAFVDGAEWDVWLGYTGNSEAYKHFAYLTVNPGMGLENGLATLSMASIDLAEPANLEAPSTEGLTVLNALELSDADQELLLADMQNYGLATLITNAQTAMPEQVALLLTLLTSAQQ